MNSQYQNFRKECLSVINKNKITTPMISLIKETYLFIDYLIKFDKRYGKKTFKNSLEKKFFLKLDNVFKKLEVLENRITDQNMIMKTKIEFRKRIAAILRKSVFLKRGWEKPKGYAGDFKMLEGMYACKPISRNLGFHLDNYYLQNDYVIAVRERKDFLKNFLSNFLRGTEKKVTILNLACGACRELQELDPKLFIKSNQIIHFDLVDKDYETIEFVRKRLQQRDWKINFINDDILGFFKRNRRKYNLIYSIGLADYLPDSILGPMIREAYRHLRGNGTFVLAHKNVKAVSAPAPDWLCDWKFIPRSIAEVSKLARSAAPNCKFKVVTPNSKLVFYLIFTK